MGGPEFEGFGEVGDAAAEVAEFEDLGWAWREKVWSDWESLGMGFFFLSFADLLRGVGICFLGGASLLAAEGYYGQSSLLLSNACVGMKRAPTKLNAFCSCDSSISLRSCP